MSSTETTKRA
jgi:hypothetical protein